MNASSRRPQGAWASRVSFIFRVEVRSTGTPCIM